MEPKLPSESRLVWLGIIQIVIGFLSALPEVINYLSGQIWDFTSTTAAVVSVLTMIAGVATILLRFVTKQPIVWSK